MVFAKKLKGVVLPSNTNTTMKNVPIFCMALAAFCAGSIRAQTLPNSPVFMPYCDATLWPLYDIQKKDSTKACQYVLAFVVDDPGQAGANPRWGGYSTYDTSHFQTRIQQLRANGGDVMVSFGGANGVELASATTVLNDLVAAYQLIIDAYNLKAIDFDIEGANVANAATIDLRNKAMVQLKLNNPGLKIWLTLPVLPTGLDNNGLNVMRTAIVNYQIDIDGVNIMAMDYGQGGDMGNHAMRAADSLFAQMTKAFSDAGISKTPAQIWKKVGITPMIGQNDVMSEIFNQSDATDVYNYAVAHNIGILSMWSINRDRACSGPSDPLYLCTKIAQTPFEFANIFRGPTGTLANCGVTAISENENESLLAVFPNPASDLINVSLDEPISEIIIRDVAGRMVLHSPGQSNRINISALECGLYLLEVKAGSNYYYRKLIKE